MIWYDKCYLFTAIGFPAGGIGRQTCTKYRGETAVYKTRNNTRNSTKTQNTQREIHIQNRETNMETPCFIKIRFCNGRCSSVKACLVPNMLLQDYKTLLQDWHLCKLYTKFEFLSHRKHTPFSLQRLIIVVQTVFVRIVENTQVNGVETWRVYDMIYLLTAIG